MKKILGILVLGLLLIPTLAMSGTFKDEEGKFGLKTKKSGFKFHLNFMDHNCSKYNAYQKQSIKLL